MAARLGRKLKIYFNDTSPRQVVQGVRQRTLKFNAEGVDITTDDDNGWRKLLAEAGLKSVDLSLSGVSKETRLLQVWADDTAAGQMRNVTVEDDETGETITGDFFLQSYQTDAETAGAIPFSAEMLSSGAVVYSAGSP